MSAGFVVNEYELLDSVKIKHAGGEVDVTSLMALGWYIVPPAQEKETPNDEAYRLITEINLATERLNYLVGNTGVEVADPTASKPIEKVSENAD